MEIAQGNNVFKSLAGSVRAHDVTGVQVNLGRLCNLSCEHCHLEASPDRTELMDWGVMLKTLDVVKQNGITAVEITGGAPELNPFIRPFITDLSQLDLKIKVRTNLTALLEPGLEGLASFFRVKEVDLTASLPCYQEQNVQAQRGKGVFKKSITILQRLNDLGYGKENGPELELVFNPGGPFLPGNQSELEQLYRKELEQHYGITFSRLIGLTNMPIGRFRNTLLRHQQSQEYFNLLYSSFNRNVLENLMCRRCVSVDWDGTLYDCDFNLALGMPLAGVPARIEDFSKKSLSGRTIVTGGHCLGCTAGAGSSCQGTLEVCQ